ncbi:hypothetical protein HAX54_029381 [Datura stramonium]|uniref:Uncharacterized protein n=1 Tax=Datura stramonium TaxID=4076 RepID=A0ABS8SA82_DATST|nr:hypothetical protein [Datura stramonium]
MEIFHAGDGLWSIVVAGQRREKREEEGGGARRLGSDGVSMVFRRALLVVGRGRPTVGFPATVRNRGRSGVGFGCCYHAPPGRVGEVLNGWWWPRADAGGVRRPGERQNGEGDQGRSKSWAAVV